MGQEQSELLKQSEQYPQLNSIIKQASEQVLLLPNQQKFSKKPYKIVPQNHTLSFNQENLIISSQQFQFNVIQDEHHIRNIRIQQSNSRWPGISIGLIISQYQQNCKIVEIYGTGTLIHSNIVITSAQNIYSKKLNKQFANTKFISGFNHKCSKICKVKKIYYPNEYRIFQKEYEKYNFALLELFDNLVDKYGYIGWSTDHKISDQQIYIYGYLYDKQFNQFKIIKQCSNNRKPKQFLYKSSIGNPLLIKDVYDMYYMIGMHNIRMNQGILYLTNEIRQTINEWIKFTVLNLERKLQLSETLVKQLASCNFHNLKYVNLNSNQIGAEICKHLSAMNWINLTTLYLKQNNIDEKACEFLQQANWIYLTNIKLSENNIRDEGCKHLVNANWPHLQNIQLNNNQMSELTCKYLRDANWVNLNKIDLTYNKLNKGCKYLKDAKWPQLDQLSKIDLSNIVITGIDEFGELLLKQLWVCLEYL